MKYIKTYESSNELKEYLLIKNKYSINIIHNKTNIDQYYINGYPEEEYPKNVWINFEYEYSFYPDLSPKKIEVGNMFAKIENAKQNLIYQSDNLQDCLDMLETLKSATKYNL